MLKRNAIKRYIRQIFAFIEKNLFLELRVKAKVVARFLNSIIQLLLMIFIFNTIFRIRQDFEIGYWNIANYSLFLMIGFCVQFSRSIIVQYKNLFIQEKYWKTLSAVLVAPVNRFTLLFATMISELVLNSIPLIIIFIIALIFFPIKIGIIILFFLVFFSIYLILGAIGLIIGVFSISREGLEQFSLISMNIILLFSCITYPKEIFPETFQKLVLLNPFYYLFDLLRLTWYLGIDYDAAILYITPIHIVIFVILTISLPIISVYLFNYVYKKYGITGY